MLGDMAAAGKARMAFVKRRRIAESGLQAGDDGYSQLSQPTASQEDAADMYSKEASRRGSTQYSVGDVKPNGAKVTEATSAGKARGGRNSVQSYEQAALGHRFTADDARASSYELIDFENDSELDSQEVIWSAEVNRGQGGKKSPIGQAKDQTLAGVTAELALAEDRLQAAEADETAGPEELAAARADVARLKALKKTLEKSSSGGSKNLLPGEKTARGKVVTKSTNERKGEGGKAASDASRIAKADKHDAVAVAAAVAAVAKTTEKRRANGKKAQSATTMAMGGFVERAGGAQAEAWLKAWHVHSAQVEQVTNKKAKKQIEKATSLCDLDVDAMQILYKMATTFTGTGKDSAAVALKLYELAAHAQVQ
eukprot:TRINITY_DN436_c0_g1_i4.p1 TRINITY_DN436_c0_g1~~TRINITY_DN436_c0_g1_i4.p1  ORF type:complete len:369 (-),score=96.65 TRINITY_DN436_c0_g1_i4:306-1412(-)